MDPDENLKEQLKLAKRLLEPDNPRSEEDVARLAELVVALDEWLKNDGFLPRRWKTSHHP